MASSKRTIVLRGELSEYREERPANAALSPGHLVELMSTGKVRKNTIVAGNIPLAIACENSIGGTLGGGGGTITDAYATDDPVQVYIPQRGSIINVRVPAAAAAIVVGDRLEPVSGGTLQKLAAGVAVAIAEEALDNSGGGSEAFIAAKVI